MPSPLGRVAPKGPGEVRQAVNWDGTEAVRFFIEVLYREIPTGRCPSE